MKKLILLSIIVFVCLKIQGQGIGYVADRNTGALTCIGINGDKYEMNWIITPDGSQYEWVDSTYGWGLGYFTRTNGRICKKTEWTEPVTIKGEGEYVVYQENDIQITVERIYENDILVENYTLMNVGEDRAYLSDIGIYTPLNDNYPSSAVCITNRTNAHIWDGENGAYVNAVRMGGECPHLGLVVTEGSVENYEIWERSLKIGHSNYRGIIAMNLPDMCLKQGERYKLQWKIFSHKGDNDFKKKLLSIGGIWSESDKYVYEKGETATARFFSSRELTNCYARLNGSVVNVDKEGDAWIVKAEMCQPGETLVEFFYDNGKKTHVDLLTVSSYENIVKKRVEFIRLHQQMKNKDDARFGAFMVYDNEADSIYLNDTPNCSYCDRDEGGERVGMGVLMAKQYLITKDKKLLPSLLDYTKFLREKLQTENYVTYSTVDHSKRNRGYNYMWIAEHYFLMYKATGNKQYAEDGYQTLQAMFRQFGYGFYAIEIPVCLGLQVLKEAGMKRQYKDLLEDFKRTGDKFVENGLNYPKHEVNYEQSIVAPSVVFLCQLYLETGIKKYLDEAKKQMPAVEAFGGQQPSFHLNEIANRHWDGYWFGKREMFGDTFPHYWSAITASAYYYYSLCTADVTYMERAKNIVRNNLCQFFEDGKASCAYLYPNRINGVKAKYYDEYSNDQDWALVFYLLVMNNI